MMISIADMLDKESLIDIRAMMEDLAFIDGRATAGWNAKLVKSNQQAIPNSTLKAIQDKILSALSLNTLFQMAVRPKTLTPIILARYGTGEAYGTHVDDAIMAGVRTDVSFTLFLSEPFEYEGGDLVIETTSGDEKIKLAAGSLFLYPSSTLHRVEAVTSGQRRVAVGWAQSYIRRVEEREILFDLDTARRSLFQRDGKCAEFDLISKGTSNLIRLWADR